LGAASSNAVATLLAAERELDHELRPEERYELCAEIGSDVPQFLIGGLSLGIGRGEQVFPLQDLRAMPMVAVAPGIGVSTPQAFRDWDKLMEYDAEPPQYGSGARLTHVEGSDRLDTFSQTVYRWLGHVHTGVPAEGGNLAEAPLLDLVRAGIENDFERVVFPQHPELREIKRALERAGASFSSLSGSGSTMFGIFESQEKAEAAARKFVEDGRRAYKTSTLPRGEYWKTFWVK